MRQTEKGIVAQKGAAGADGVGVADITSHQDANGNIVYTITLTDGTTRDFAAQKGAPGAAGANGVNGQDAADSVECLVASFRKTSIAPDTCDKMMED